MHLKILIGVLTLGLVSASPKAAAEPAAKASPQYYSSGQPYYFPIGANNFEQNYAAQPFQGQHSSGLYNVRFSPSTYGLSSGNYFGDTTYSQAPFGNYYQPNRLAPIGYSSGVSTNDAQSANYYNARLWPKSLVSPAGSPSPALVGSPPLYYPSSTPSPVVYQTTGQYANSALAGNYQIPVSTPSPASYQPLVAVPLKVGSRNSFQPQVSKYVAPQNVPVTTPTPYVTYYQQQSTPAPYVQSFQQSTAAPLAAFQSTSAQYQQPTAVPYNVNYQQYSTPSLYHGNYQHQPGAAYQLKYQPSSPAPYVYNQQTAVSPFAAYQQQTGSRYISQYPQPTVSPFPANYPRIPVPVAFPQSQIQSQSVKPTLISSVTPTNIYPSSTIKPQVVPAVLPTSSPPTVTITERAFFPVSTTPAPISKPKATIIKSEYTSGTIPPQYIQSFSTASPVFKPELQQSGYVSPQYNHVISSYSTGSPIIQSEYYNSGAVSPQYNYVVPSYSTPRPFAKSVINSGVVSPQYSHIPSYSTISPPTYVANAYLPQSK